MMNGEKVRGGIGRLERTSEFRIWRAHGTNFFTEKCARDLLTEAWSANQSEPIRFCFHYCGHFLMSRDHVRWRPLAVWKQFLKIKTLQDRCHERKPARLRSGSQANAASFTYSEE